MPKGSLKNRKILSSSSANRSTLKAEKERESEKKNEGTSRGDPECFDIHKLLKAQTEKNQRKSWNRLDRGIRIQKIRSWVKSQEWTDDIKKKATETLIKSIKSGGLSSSTSVDYNKKTCEIEKMPCLKLVYPIDVSGGDPGTPVDVLIQKNDRKTKRTARV